MEKIEVTLLLERFQVLWNYSLNGDYKNSAELKRIALKLKDEHEKGNTKGLIPIHLISLRKALIIANIK